MSFRMLSALLVSTLLAPSIFANPFVKNCHGRDVSYEGIYRDKIETFLSIPYGKDTSGEHRFKAPRTFFPRHGTTIESTTAGPACPQALGGADRFPTFVGIITEISEDCLHLNVYRPNGTQTGDKLPVLLYIHGGSFIAASKDDPLWQPSGLILESTANGHPVMVVNINYRLGIFGFAKSDALHAEGSLNAGLKDQRLAIEWVSKNIASFGGDPDKITIYGQSSGGLAVGMQIMAYGGSKPALFHQAICQSQALEPGITGGFTNTAMANVVAASNCNPTNIQSEGTVSCLRGLSMNELVNLQDATRKGDAASNIGDLWLPTVDGDFLPAAPSKLIAEGRFSNVPTMMGWCEDDTNLFVDSTIQTADDTLSFFSEYLAGMSSSHVHDLLSLYPVSEFSSDPTANRSAQFYRSGRILRDILMVCEPMLYGAALTKAGNPVYFYNQNQTFLTNALASIHDIDYGVVHTSEFAYVFGNLSHFDFPSVPYQPTASDFALLKRESRSWSTFASHGKPSLRGHDTLQGWETLFAAWREEPGVFVIGGPMEGFAHLNEAPLRKQKLKERCGFLNRQDIVKELQF
nr:secreted lipase [Quercus suber]